MRTIVNIDVPDLERAIAFYSDALGLELARRLDDDVAELVGASSTLYLLEKREGSEASKGSRHVRRYDERHWTPWHVDFVVDDVDAAAERALRAGATQESERIQWRGSTCITFSDPFGHGFCFIEFEAGTYSGD